MKASEIFNKDLKKSYIIIKETSMTEKYKDIKFRVVLATGGFGCDPSARGRAVFVHSFLVNEDWRINRSDVERLAVQEEIALYGDNTK